MDTKKQYARIMDMLDMIKDKPEKLSKVLGFLDQLIVSDDGVDHSANIPEEYREIVYQIADIIDQGEVCYLNPDTMEIQQVSEENLYDSSETFQEQNDDMLDEYDLDYMKWDNRVRFEPLEKDELYNIMQKFVDKVDDQQLSRKLENALEKDNPTAYFSDVIHNTELESDWMIYKNAETRNYVNAVLQDVLRLK